MRLMTYHKQLTKKCMIPVHLTNMNQLETFNSDLGLPQKTGQL